MDIKFWKPKSTFLTSNFKPFCFYDNGTNIYYHENKKTCLAQRIFEDFECLVCYHACDIFTIF